MQKKIIFILIFLLLNCTQLNESKGEYNEVVIITSEIDKKIIKSHIEKIFYSYIHTPFEENVYNLQWGDVSKFKDYLNYKNLFFVSLSIPEDSTIDIINKKFTDKYSDKIFLLENLYSKNQIVLIFNSSDSTDFINQLNNYEDWFLEQIDKNISENINEKIIYKGKNEELETLIQKHYKLDMFVQKDYHEIKKDSLYNFLWIGRGYPYRWITIMKFDLNDINDSTSHWKNYFKLLKTYMPSVSVSEYYQKKIYDDNGSIFKLQGLYEEDFSDTGGPFFANIIKLNNNIGMYVSGFVNNPGKSKYFFLKELELIIENIKIKRKENE